MNASSTAPTPAAASAAASAAQAPASTLAVTVSPPLAATPNALRGAADYMLANPILIAALVGGLVTMIVARLTLRGVRITIDAAASRSKVELDHAATQAEKGRKHSLEQAARERQHSADEAHRERITTIRREVYMAAIKEIVAINGFIAGMYKQDLSKLSSEMALSALSNASTQVAAVGNLETAIQARDMIKAYGKVFFLAIVELAPRISLVFAQAAHDKDLAHAKQITQQIVEQSKYAAGAEQAKYYSRQLVEQQRQEAALASMSADVAHQISLIDLRYSEWVLAQFGDLTERLDSLLDAIRKELGLESDLERLRKQSQEIRAELLEAVAHMKAKLGLP